MIECCCGSLKDVIIANENGYDRIELNSALQLGGLTPSIGLIQLALRYSKIPIVVMIRPRAGGFYYTEEEKATMLFDLNEVLKLDVEGICFGALNADRSIDACFVKEVVQLTHAQNKKVVFSRAFDVIEAYDMDCAISKLIDLKVDRILTSGRKNTCLEALDSLSELQFKYQNQIKIVVGSGVKQDHIPSILKTHINEIHGSFSEVVYDTTSKGNEVSFEVNLTQTKRRD